MSAVRLLSAIAFLFAICGCLRGPTGPQELSAIPYLSALEDPSLRLSPRDALKAAFRPLQDPIFDAGFSSSSHWLRLQTPPSQTKDRLFIVFESLTLDQIEIYSADDPPRLQATAGDHLGRSSWAVPWSDYPAFPVEADKQHLFRLQSTSLLMMPVTIRSETDLREFTERRTYISALYAGFTLMLCFMAAALFFVLRDFVYLLYAAYIAAQTIAFAALFSSFYRLLWPESPYIQNHLYFLAQALSLAFGTSFFRVFMDLAERRPRLNGFVWVVAGLSLVIAVGTLFSSQNVLFSRALTVIYLVWIPLFLFMTMRTIEPRRFDMWMFTLVWGAVYVSGILYMLAAARIIPYHPLFFYGQTALFPLDAVFFVLTLYQRYRTIEASRLKLEREMNATLARLASLSKPVEVRKKGGYPRSKLSGLDVAEKLQRLDQLLRIQKVFKNEELTLADLAAELGVTSHQLSEMCNAQLNTSFPKLLAYHRVQEARHLLEKEGLSILQIAFEAGFASKSAFNIEFKRVTGLTPREYRARPEPLRAGLFTAS